ncbi:hypothetical protein [Sphingomonas sp.]|uniref:hypothetical protein n=1 Tax=Sphingomonas sp. TaxID=28214 RepID=UPI0025E3CC28|nr:hypothetical protein [Sphingomonas sp.]
MLAAGASAAPTAPLPPDGAAANLAVPRVGADGQFETPNRSHSALETLWHLRAALNVAALNCTGEAAEHIVADYNALLVERRLALAAANTAVEAGMKARHGESWQEQHDADMTRVYNFFSQPPAQRDFCIIAEQVAYEARTVPEAALADFAAARMAVLEAPFLAFYARYHAYRVALNRWQAGQPGQTAAR